MTEAPEFAVVSKLIQQLQESAEKHSANVELLQLLDDHTVEQAEQLDRAIVEARRTAWPQACYAADRWTEARTEADALARRGDTAALIEVEGLRRELVEAVAAVAESVGGVPDQWTTELGIGSPPRTAGQLSTDDHDALRRLQERRAAAVAGTVHNAVGLTRLGYAVNASWRGHARQVALGYVRLLRIEERIQEIKAANQ